MRLIQTDGRNRLIHTPRDTKRSKSLKIVSEKADRIFHALANEGKSPTFLPILEDGDSPRASPANTFALQTELTSEALQKRILGLFRDSRTIEEEQGVNVLYLAIGFLRWFESEDSETIREAPLLLLPVSLSRTNVRTAFKLGIRDEDITSNLPLQERLREFGITLPSTPDEDDWLPSQYFEAVRDSVSSQSRWSIDEDGILLGFFSFSKFLMFRDLDPENWPDDELLASPLLASLLVDGFPYEEPLFPDDRNLDQVFDPASLIHVVDADGSQANRN